MVKHDINQGNGMSVFETDLLIIGGGIGGCFAAATTSDDINVLMIDKGGVDRCGAAGPGGPDHLSMFENDGFTAEDFIKSLREKGFPAVSPHIDAGLSMDENLNYTLIKKSNLALEEMEKLGCNLKWEDGEYNWFPWYMSLGKKTGFRVHGQNFKYRLASAVKKKKNVKILERTYVIDLLKKDNRVIGATGFNIRTGEFIVCKSKMILLSTGQLERIYEPETGATGKYKNVYCLYPGSGCGHGIVYRAGGELTGMEFPYTTLHGFDFLSMHYGHFTHAGEKKGQVFDGKGEYVMDLPFSYNKYLEFQEKGNIPIYYSLEHITEEQHGMREIGNADMIPIFSKYLEERGLEPRKHKFEVMPPKAVGMSGSLPGLCGVLVDEEGRTSMEGLYAIGDMIGSVHFRGVTTAAVQAVIVGKNAKDIIGDTKLPVLDEEQIQQHRETAFRHLNVKDGVRPIEYESKIRAICEKYAGRVMMGGMLNEGIKRLTDIREDWFPRIKATNYHELMKTMECRNLLDMAEVHLRCSFERKESRYYFYRLDYPEKDPKYDGKNLVVKQIDGKLDLTLKAIPTLKPEYEKEVKRLCQ